MSEGGREGRDDTKNRERESWKKRKLRGRKKK